MSSRNDKGEARSSALRVKTKTFSTFPFECFHNIIPSSLLHPVFLVSLHLGSIAQVITVNDHTTWLSSRLLCLVPFTVGFHVPVKVSIHHHHGDFYCH